MLNTSKIKPMILVQHGRRTIVFKLSFGSNLERSDLQMSSWSDEDIQQFLYHVFNTMHNDDSLGERMLLARSVTVNIPKLTQQVRQLLLQQPDDVLEFNLFAIIFDINITFSAQAMLPGPIEVEHTVAEISTSGFCTRVNSSIMGSSAMRFCFSLELSSNSHPDKSIIDPKGATIEAEYCRSSIVEDALPNFIGYIDYRYRTISGELMAEYRQEMVRRGVSIGKIPKLDIARLHLNPNGFVKEALKAYEILMAQRKDYTESKDKIQDEVLLVEVKMKPRFSETEPPFLTVYTEISSITNFQKVGMIQKSPMIQNFFIEEFPESKQAESAMDIVTQHGGLNALMGNLPNFARRIQVPPADDDGSQEQQHQ